MSSRSPDPGQPRRIGDAERQAAVTELSDHYAAGRLDRAEFDQRSEAALTARTGAELVPLFADLPSTRQPTEAPSTDVARTRSGNVASTAAGDHRALRSWIGAVQGLIWPILIMSAIFLGLNWYIAIGVGIISTMVLGQVAGQLKARRQLQEGPDDRDELPPAPGRLSD